MQHTTLKILRPLHIHTTSTICFLRSKPLPLPCALIDLADDLCTTHLLPLHASQGSLDIPRVFFPKLTHCETAHELRYAGNEAFLVDAEVLEGICEPCFKLAHFVFNC